ncbi:MAG: AsmA family protein [Acidobacteriia bacterium]|nr:AsmA family protein [Terriglobia bacterium]
MRKLAISVAIIVAILVIIIVVVPLVLDINRYHGVIQAQLEKALGRSVTFGQMHLSLLPPTVRMDDVVIGEAPQFGRGPFASMDAIDASVKLLPLLHQDVQISSLDLKGPKLQLIRNAQGVWNFSTLGQAQQQPSKPEAQGGGFVLSNLKISNGQVTLVDDQKHFQGVYNNIDVSLHGYAPGKPFDFSAALRLPGPGTETLALSGTAGPIDQADMLKTPFDGKLQLKEVSLGGIQKVLDVPSLKGMEGTVSGNLALKNDNGTLSSEGTAELKDGVVRNVKIGYPVSLDYKFTDRLASDQIHIDRAKLQLGSTPLSISGDINGGATPATANVHVTAQDASIAEVARLASAFGVAFNPNMTVNGKLTAELSAQGPLAQPALNGNLSGKDMHVSGGDLKQPVDVSGIELALTPRDIRSNPFTANSGGTKVAVQFALSNYTSASPLVDATLRTFDASIPELLAIARAYGISAAEGISGAGNISLDLHAAGPIKNTDAMNFSGSGKIVSATLNTPQITQPLAIKNADLQFSQNGASLNNLNASLAGTNATGNMTLRNFNAPQVRFTLNADQVDVVKLQQALGSAPQQPQHRATLDLCGIRALACAVTNDAGAHSPASTFSWNLIPRAEAQTKSAAPQSSILERISGGGSITAGKVIYDQLLLDQVHSNVVFDHGVIKLAPITAGLYGGQQIGTITLDMRPTPMAVTVQTKLNQVDANKLLSSVSSLKQTVYGLLAGNANASFRAASSADMARTLNGTIALDLTKGKLAHVDLLNELAGVGKFVGAGFKSPSSTGSEPFTDIVQLTGNFNVVNGLAQTNNVKAVIPGGTMAAEGALNLATEELNMHVTAVLSKAMSQQVGGTQVGGFMQTALANQQGELVIPILLTGTFGSPRVAPDLQKIAQMKLQNLLPTAGNPGGLVSGILGAVGGKGGAQQRGLGGVLGALAGQQQQPKQPTALPQQQPQQQNPLGDLLNQVLGDKKKQQKQPPPPPKK